MKKSLIFGTILSGSFLFSNNVFASEQQEMLEKEINSVDEVVESIVFDGSQDVLVTEHVIIRKISDVVPVNYFHQSGRLDSPLITPFAGDGVWTKIGSDEFYTTSKTVSSTGGDFKVEIGQMENSKVRYQLREDDVAVSSLVSDITINSIGVFEFVFRDINGWLDGPDNEAEFYLKKLNGVATKTYVNFYD